jgi:hypothetical protein
MAQENLRRGQDFWDRREVGSENLYKAWRAYRESWLTLEALEGVKPTEYAVAREKTREAQETFDRRCSDLLLEAQNGHDWEWMDRARSKLEHGELRCSDTDIPPEFSR